MEDEDIIQLKTRPGAQPENSSVQPAAAAEAGQFVKPEVNTRRNRLTKAERHYRRSVFSAIFTIILVLFLIVFILLGAASMYIVKELTVEPEKSYIIYDTAKKLKNTDGIKNKFDILINGVKKFRAGSEVSGSGSNAEKSGGGKLRAIRERNRINEKAANSGVVK